MTINVRDRIRGTILAAACGNSLGGACLGMSRKDIMFCVGVHGLHDYVAGMSKSLLPEYKPGALMSDTLLAMRLADSLIANKGQLAPEDLKERFAQLLKASEFLDAAPGAHCLLPLRRLASDLPSKQDADSLHVSAAARAYPVGCLPQGADVISLAVEQAKLSQADSQVWAASAVLAHAVKSFIGGQKVVTEDEVRVFVKDHFEIATNIDQRFADAWDDVAPDLDYENPAEELPYSLINVDSHVNEAVPTAVGIFLIFRHDLEEAVAAAASCGGDTDTVAAIVGALSGAYHGASAIPERWLNQISQRDELEAIADGLLGLWNTTRSLQSS